MAKSKKIEILEQQVAELTTDVQRTRADFENYRKRMDEEKRRARELGEMSAVMKLLPALDVIERAIAQLPEELRGHAWVEGVAGLTKQLAKLMNELHLERIKVVVGETEFDPELHEAVSADDGEGEREVIAEELQAGYCYQGAVVRPTMVRVTHQS